MPYRKQKGLAKRRDQVAEMSSPELVLSPSAEAENTCILGEDAGFEHVLKNCATFSLRHGISDIPEPGTDVRSWNTSQLKREGHDLLREEVCWSRWRNHRIDLALAPQGGQRQAGEEFL